MTRGRQEGAQGRGCVGGRRALGSARASSASATSAVLALVLVLLASLSACGKYAPPRRAPDATRPPPLEAVEAGPGDACEDPEAKRP